MSPSSFGRSIDFGGDRPVAGVMADFNGDGTSDLLVASNGSGLVSLLLGGANGPALAGTFSRPDVVHPSDLALLNADGRLNVYVTQEGQEAAFLLTSFGIAVPSPASLAEAPAPADVFLVSGPGFATVQSLLAGEDSPPQEGGRPAGLPSEGAVQALAATRVLVATLLLGGGDDQGEGAPAAVYAGSSSRLNRFLLGLEDVVPAPAAPVEGDTGDDSIPAGNVPPPEGEVFRQGLPDLQPQELLHQVAEGLLEAGTSVRSPVADHLPLREWPIRGDPIQALGAAPERAKPVAADEVAAANRPASGDLPVVEAREETPAWWKPWAGAVLLASVRKSRSTGRNNSLPTARNKPSGLRSRQA
jgi:hypothetical protein